MEFLVISRHDHVSIIHEKLIKMNYQVFLHTCKNHRKSIHTFNEDFASFRSVQCQAWTDFLQALEVAAKPVVWPIDTEYF